MVVHFITGPLQGRICRYPAFLPCVISTSGRLHGEFLRLLYIIAHRRASKWFRQHIAMMSPARTPSSSAAGNTFGTHAPLSATLRRGLTPNGCRWRSTPFVATALFPYTQDDRAFPATVFGVLRS